MIRRARRHTGRTLDVATTMTVTPDNLGEVPLVIRWMCENADAFKTISFQPVASVGRTEHGLGGSVDAEDLWARIAEGLHGDGGAPDLLRHGAWLGHPACSRFVQGLVVDRPGRASAFHPLFRPADARDAAVVHEGMARFGGFTTWLDTRAQALARLAGLIARAPGFVVSKAIPFLFRWPRRLDPEHPARFVWRWLRGRARVNCAYAVAKGASAPGDPTLWKVVDGKLYVNKNAEVQKLWNQDVPAYIGQADRNWPAVMKK